MINPLRWLIGGSGRRTTRSAPVGQTGAVPLDVAPVRRVRRRAHPAWGVAGWSLGTISAAVSVNLVLYGLTAPFAGGPPP